MAGKFSKKYKGLLVWDFDGVLFKVERYRLDNHSALVSCGIPTDVIIDIIKEIKEKNKHFSIRNFIRGLRKRHFHLSEKLIRKLFHGHLVANNYYSQETDELLHRLGKKGFLQMILSLGSAPFQYKKMFAGCGVSFRRHFVKMFVTRGQKFIILKRLRRKYFDLPLIFIDDTKEHLELAKKHIPDIVTIHYSNLVPGSLGRLEKKILKYGKEKR